MHALQAEEQPLSLEAAEGAGERAVSADHARIGPNHLWWYLQPFLSIIVIQIFFLGSLFFAVAALTRKIFVVYLQGVALFMIYVIGLTVYFGPPKTFAPVSSAWRNANSETAWQIRRSMRSISALA